MRSRLLRWPQTLLAAMTPQELAKEFRRLAAEARQGTVPGDVEDRAFTDGMDRAYKQAAQMVEEKLS
jgi:hypothetical protein